MRLVTTTLELRTTRERELVDITAEAQREVARSGIREGVCSLYAQGATAALMIQENADPNIALDVLDCLQEMAPPGRWRHDRIDDNGHAHIQAGIVGPSESVPIRDGRLAFSTWQNLFFCELDGPREVRRVLMTLVGEGGS